MSALFPERTPLDNKNVLSWHQKGFLVVSWEAPQPVYLPLPGGKVTGTTCLCPTGNLLFLTQVGLFSFKSTFTSYLVYLFWQLRDNNEVALIIPL